MSDEKLERVFRTVDPGRRATLKKLVVSAAFSVPIIASFPVKDLAYAQTDSVERTTTVFVTKTDFSTSTTTTSTSTTVTVTTGTCST